MIWSSRIHQYINSHLRCSPTIAVLLIVVGGEYRTRGESCVFILEQFRTKKRFMLCCVLLLFSVVNPSCASTVLQYCQLPYYKLVCHAMIRSSRIHQYINSHLHCSQTIAVPLFAELFGFVNSQSGEFRGVETPTTFPSETYHSHLREVLNAAVEWTEPHV